MECKHSVSLCMIAKNEASCLKRCIESVSGIVTEVIVVDTGSTDNTVEIAKQCGAIVKYFKWNHSFSDARNYALSFATKEWILVLDADEYLRQEDREKLIEAINDISNDGYIIKTLNYTGDIGSDSYIVNLNQRIFKNNKNYHYVGSIHEQVACIDESKQKKPFAIIDVGFYHTGYLLSVVKGKNKTKRNSEILEKILEKDPNNGFHIFNLANEYSQMGEGKKALELYDKAYYSANFTQGYVPKLVIFRITCLISQGKMVEAVMAIEEGLKMYPDYTDLVYYRGTLEREAGQVTKAIRSFKKCLEMGRPRVELEYQTLCYDFGPALCLAEMYEEYEDYENSLTYYNKCLALQPGKYQLVYKIMKCLKGMLKDKSLVIETLSRYFNLNDTLNRIVFIDALIQANYYEEAKVYLETSEELMSNTQLIFLNAKTNFYLGAFEKSIELFEFYEKVGSRDDIEHYLYLINLIDFSLLEGYEFSEPYQIITNCLLQNNFDRINHQKKDIIFNKALLLIKEAVILNKEELVKQITVFLDNFTEMDYHLFLAGLYHDQGANELAKEQVIKFIKHTGDCPKLVAKLLASLD